jgi:serine/alanine adding enzyme
MNINVFHLDLNDNSMCQKWDGFVSNFPEDGHHHKTCFLQAVKTAFPEHQHESLVAQNSDGDIVGILPLIGLKSPVFGKQLASIPFFNYGGALAQDDITRRELMAEAKLISDKGYDKCIIRDSQAFESKESWTTQKHKANLVLALPDDINKIGAGNAKKRAKLRSQAKLALRKADDLNVNVHQAFGGEELLDDFYQVFSTHMRDLGTPVYPRSFFEAIYQNIKSTLTVYYWDNEPVGCWWLFEHGERVSIPWASTLRKVNAFSVNANMYYNILDRCINNGNKLFDFGRSTIDAGTYKFKLQWGAEPKQCHWHTLGFSDDVNENKGEPSGKMQVLIKTWQKLPLWLANKIGPLIIKDIP